MFRGSSFNKIDAKSRIIIPARFNEILNSEGADSLFVSQMDGCLVVYTPTEWKKIESKILSMAEKSESMRRFRRIFIGSADEVRIDAQNRILISPPLKNDASLEKDIVIVGVLDHFEIWSKSKWEREKALLENDLTKIDVRHEISKLGL